MENNLQTSIFDKKRLQAYQKSLEIELLAAKEAELIRKEVLSQQIVIVDAQSQKWMRKLHSQKKIQRSNVINTHRMAIIRKKHQLCERIYFEVEGRLNDIASKPENEDQYKEILLKFVVQGLMRMFEAKIIIKGKEKDMQTISEIIPFCIEAYNYEMISQIGREYPLELTLSTNNILKQRKLVRGKSLNKKEEEEYCIGGVILSDETGNITYKNTLDCRLNILKEISLPDIRAMIWNKHQTITDPPAKISVSAKSKSDIIQNSPKNLLKAFKKA